MATLHNFHSANAGSGTVKLYPDLHLRQEWLKRNVHQPRQWDIPNLVPLGPIQRRDIHVLDGAHVDPQVTERRDESLSRMYVPLRPYTRMVQGDSADSRLLIADKGNGFMTGWNLNGTHVPLWNHSRYAPY